MPTFSSTCAEAALSAFSPAQMLNAETIETVAEHRPCGFGRVPKAPGPVIYANTATSDWESVAFRQRYGQLEDVARLVRLARDQPADPRADGRGVALEPRVIARSARPIGKRAPQASSSVYSQHQRRAVRRQSTVRLSRAEAVSVVT